MQFCEYNTWRTVCENNYTDFDYGRFCTQFGYNSEFMYSIIIIIIIIMIIQMVLC